MNGSILLWLLFAVVFFWAYGLNNRLGRMRARSLDALDSLEKHMRQYAGLVQSYVACGQDELPVRWQRLMDALNTLDAELKDVRTTPLSGTGLGRLWRAFEALQAAWTSLVKAPIDVAGVVVSDALRTDWDATTFKVLSTRGGVNGILSKYNEAVGQVPARWMARLLGYVPVGQIE
jgi:hypothetical protein